ncbi:MAG: helix-turn-helix domain-containing protein [Clostridia bacterium]|nr:helix-turn-helix domain-containing protein [Clostridia bacterium]
MFYDNELQFLCETFKKSHVRALAVTPNDFVSTVFDTSIEESLGATMREDRSVCKFFGNLEARTMYKTTDAFKRCYIYLLLPDTEKTTILFVGPYLPAPLTHGEVLEIAEKNGISPKNRRYLEEYYSAITVISENSHLFIMLDTFCERIWDSPSFAIVDDSLRIVMPASPITDVKSDSFYDILVSMKAMEKRYDFENELIRAVTLGQLHKEKRLLAAFSESMFEKRAADPLRNAKNYCIIMNTLLRKAAEAGGVHPVYIDRVSSSFALKIEQMPALSRNFELMREMFRSYCRLVRRHSMKDFSLVVQKTILLIDSDLSAELSLSALAGHQNVSAGYLSAIFKKETGKTVSEYIREKRVRHAIHLLSTTRLQIQTIALHCGIMDVQYFSKIFKRETGKTPREYRESIGPAR